MRKKCYWIKSISFQKHVYHGFKSICYRISNILIGSYSIFLWINSIHAFGKKCFWFNSIFFSVYLMDFHETYSVYKKHSIPLTGGARIYKLLSKSTFSLKISGKKCPKFKLFHSHLYHYQKNVKIRKSKTVRAELHS